MKEKMFSLNTFDCRKTIKMNVGYYSRNYSNRQIDSRTLCEQSFHLGENWKTKVDEMTQILVREQTLGPAPTFPLNL